MNADELEIDVKPLLRSYVAGRQVFDRPFVFCNPVAIDVEGREEGVIVAVIHPTLLLQICEHLDIKLDPRSSGYLGDDDVS